MSFGPCNSSLKIWESIRTPIPKVGTHLEVCDFIITPSYTFGSMKCDFWASLLARTFASLCFGRELRVRVVITNHR
jgi:hypothetical protein